MKTKFFPFHKDLVQIWGADKISREAFILVSFWTPSENTWNFQLQETKKDISKQGGILAGKLARILPGIVEFRGKVLREKIMQLCQEEGWNIPEIFCQVKVDPPKERNFVLETSIRRKIFLSQEEISCHRKIFSVTGRYFLSQEDISCQKKKFQVSGRNFLLYEDISSHRQKFGLLEGIFCHRKKFPVTGWNFLSQWDIYYAISTDEKKPLIFSIPDPEASQVLTLG